MAKSLAAGALAREARMVLRLLSKPGARLAETESGQWVIETNGRRQRGQTTDAAIMRELAGRDWLIREPSGSYRISVAGERWLAGICKGAENASPAERFADQHRLVQRRDEGARSGLPRPHFNEAESPLGWLKNRRDKSGAPLISEAQYDAGERLRVDFTVAQLSPRVTLSWNSSVAPGSHGRSGRRPDSLEVNERALAAKRRFMRALDAVGPELSGILMEVCCLSRGLEAAERSLGWPQRSGKLVLQIALTRLARHYGLTRNQTEPHRPAAIRHWGVEDYRPQVGVAPDDGDQA